jgi:flagellar motor switch protein FliN/FliY
MMNPSSIEPNPLPGQTPLSGTVLNPSEAPMQGQANLNLLLDVNLLLTVELGRAQLTVKEILDLQKGSVVELDRVAGEVVDVYVNDHLFARGEVVVVDDKFGVRITELITRGAKEEAH